MLNSRRSFIAGAGALGMGALGGAASAPRARAAARPPLIDIHSHFGDSPARTIELMDRAGIAMALGLPGQVQVSGPTARDVTRRRNDDGVRFIRDHPNRLGLFASLPMLDTDAALAEIAYAADVLQTDGFGMSANYADAWLGDPRFEPVFAELSRRKAVVFVHPWDADCCMPDSMTYMELPVLGSWMEWPVNTARTIFSLIKNRTLARNPDVKMIFAHGGGVMPYLLGRVSGFINRGDTLRSYDGPPAPGARRMAEMFPDGLEADFAKLYFELAQAYTPRNLTLLRQVVPSSHLLFGTDYAFFSMEGMAEQFHEADIPEQTRREIAYENALALFPRLKANWPA